MSKPKLFMSAICSYVMMLFMPMTAYASSLGEWAQSDALIGSSQVYYSAPWLVSGVQFVISWVCIIAFLTFYMSFLCSVVSLSNKELFWLIDTLKREQESSDSKRGPLNGVIERFRSGSSQEGLQGGADNFIVFVLMLGINFKRYSVYKNVEADSGGGGGGEKGPKYQYSDTMATFFLKSLFDSVMVTFILSIALSGLLIRVWFWMGDVLVVYTDRAVQTNLVAAIDRVVGTNYMYNFSLSGSGTQDGLIAEQISTRIFQQIVTGFPNITVDQAQMIGVTVENEVSNRLNMDRTAGSGIPALTNYANLIIVDGNTIPPDQMVARGQQAWNGFSWSSTINNNSSHGIQGGLTFDFNQILGASGLSTPDGRAINPGFMHIRVHYTQSRSGDYLQEGGINGADNSNNSDSDVFGQ